MRRRSTPCARRPRATLPAPTALPTTAPTAPAHRPPSRRRRAWSARERARDRAHARAASFGARGGGRGAFFVIDWILGSAAGTSALVTPRGHLRNLLGGAAPHAWSQSASAFALVALAGVFGAIAVARARR